MFHTEVTEKKINKKWNPYSTDFKNSSEESIMWRHPRIWKWCSLFGSFFWKRKRKYKRFVISKILSFLLSLLIYFTSIIVVCFQTQTGRSEEWYRGIAVHRRGMDDEWYVRKVCGVWGSCWFCDRIMWREVKKVSVVLCHESLHLNYIEISKCRSHFLSLSHQAAGSTALVVTIKLLNGSVLP